MRILTFVHYLKTKINKKEYIGFYNKMIVTRTVLEALTLVFILTLSVFYSIIYEDLNYSSNALIKANPNVCRYPKQ